MGHFQPYTNVYMDCVKCECWQHNHSVSNQTQHWEPPIDSINSCTLSHLLGTTFIFILCVRKGLIYKLKKWNGWWSWISFIHILYMASVGSWVWPDVWSFMGRFPTCVSNIMSEHKSRDLNQSDLIILNDSIKT